MVSFKLFELLKKVDSSLYLYGPFVLMFMTNFAIAFKCMRAKCKNYSAEPSNEALVKSATRGTAMVVTVSVTFLILTAPTAVNEVLPHFLKLGNNPLYNMLIGLGQFLNHSIKFVLCTVVWSRFRKELFETNLPKGEI